MEQEILQRIHDIVNKMRCNVVEMTYRAGRNGSHIGGSLSSIEILACLYQGVMKVKCNDPLAVTRDYFILSKGHCVVSFYSALYFAGFLSEEDLGSFERDDADFPGHPVMNPVKGIEFSGGSLGMGLSQAVGIALGAKHKKQENHVFVLLGDGECNEGAVWEAAMAASHFQLDNLIAIVDYNKLQADGRNEAVMNVAQLSQKFAAFGFDVDEVDGHKIEEIYNALMKMNIEANKKPKLLIAHTLKGKGISFMENNCKWHHAALDKAEYEQAIEELRAGEKNGN